MRQDGAEGVAHVHDIGRRAGEVAGVVAGAYALGEEGEDGEVVGGLAFTVARDSGLMVSAIVVEYYKLIGSAYLEDDPVPSLSYMKMEYPLEMAYSAKLYSDVFTVVGIQ